MPEWCFLIFWIFFLFFLEFSCPRRAGTKFGTEIFSLFLGLSHTSLDRNYAGMFFKILNFFFLFLFEIFLPKLGWNGIRDSNFFLSFSAYLISFWLEIMPEWCFLIFLIFLLFFWEFSCLSWVGTEFGTKMFLSFTAYLNPVWIEIMPDWCFFNFLNFFAISLGIF